MKREIATLWVDALRSGKFEQGTGQMLKDGKYCCLAVLCFISHQGWFSNIKDEDGAQAYEIYGMKPEYLMLNEVIRKWAGIRTSHVTVGKEAPKSLADMNDSGSSFAEIADIIEQNWEAI